jgi:hypothetical protein
LISLALGKFCFLLQNQRRVSVFLSMQQILASKPNFAQLPCAKEAGRVYVHIKQNTHQESVQVPSDSLRVRLLNLVLKIGEGPDDLFYAFLMLLKSL